MGLIFVIHTHFGILFGRESLYMKPRNGSFFSFLTKFCNMKIGLFVLHFLDYAPLNIFPISFISISSFLYGMLRVSESTITITCIFVSALYLQEFHPIYRSVYLILILTIPLIAKIKLKW